MVTELAWPSQALSAKLGFLLRRGVEANRSEHFDEKWYNFVFARYDYFQRHFSRNVYRLSPHS